jgi:hypothetical protein
VLAHDSQARAERLEVRQVDRISGGGVGRQDGGHSTAPLVIPRHDVETGVAGRVRGEDPAAAGDGHDAQAAVAASGTPRQKNPGRIDQVLRAFDPEDADLLHRRLKHVIADRERSAVRHRGPRARLSPAHLDQDDGLA